MLQLHIAFVDSSELAYAPNSLYTKPLPVAQRNVLYLATALSARGHHITLFQAACDTPLQQANLSVKPLPEHGLSETQAMDVVVHINSLESLLELSREDAEHPLNILWSFEHPQHLSLLPLKNPALHPHVDLLLFSSPLYKPLINTQYGLPSQHMQVFPVAMTRTLRKRFPHTQAFAEQLPQELTLCFIQRPEKGLSETLDMFETLKQGFKDLRLKVLLPTEERPWSPQENTLLDRCQADPQIQVFSPLPRPAYVEQLIQSHILCAPRLALEPTLYDFLDALAAGCDGVDFQRPELDSLGQDLIRTIPMEPLESQTVRYTQALAERLSAWDANPQEMIKKRFHVMAQMGTFFTWDLRVWEFESLVFQLQKLRHPPSALQ